MYRLGTNKCKRVGFAPKRLLFGFNVIVSQSEYYTEKGVCESSPNFRIFYSTVPPFLDIRQIRSVPGKMAAYLPGPVTKWYNPDHYYQKCKVFAGIIREV
jgi:hypothetical protein